MNWFAPEEDWISDPGGFVFLPRAMLEIGKALFPGKWTGDEPITTVKFEAEQRSKMQAVKAYNAAVEAERPRHSVESRRCTAATVTDPASATVQIAPSPALAIPEPPTLRPIDQAPRDAIERFKSLCARVAFWCKSGELVSGWRPREGGNVVEFPQAWWNTEGGPLYFRFRDFYVDPVNPFLYRTGLPLFTDSERFKRQGWICISRDSLNRVLVQHGTRKADISDATPRESGRPKGSGSVKELDRRLAVEAVVWIKGQPKGTTAADAARHFSGKLAGTAIKENKEKRFAAAVTAKMKDAPLL